MRAFSTLSVVVFATVSFIAGSAFMFMLVHWDVVTVRGASHPRVVAGSVSPRDLDEAPQNVSRELSIERSKPNTTAGPASRKAYFADWEAEEFETPEVEAIGRTVRIVGGTSTSGMFFRRGVNAPGVYILSVAGDNLKNQVNLRITRDGHPSEWHDAPVGRRTFKIELQSKLEVLIYADQPFEYELKDLALKPFGSSVEQKQPNQLLVHSPPDLKALGRKIGTEIALYGTGRVAADSHFTLVSNDGSPGGMRFVFAPPGPEPYKFTIDGIARRGNPTLRVGEPSKPLKYMKPPDEPFSFVVGENGPVEFILYSDAHFEFAIRDIRIERCDDCRSNAELKARILAETPGLADALVSNRLAGARLLLDWASKNGNWTEDMALEEKTYAAVVANRAAEIFFDIFEPNTGAVFCGGLAIFLNKVFHLFGYDSFVVDFGHSDSSDYTHLTTVVAQRDGDRWLYYIFDPWWNAAFKDSSDQGEFLPLFEIVDRLQSGAVAGIHLDEWSKAKRDWLMPAEKRNVCEDLLEDRGNQVLCKVPSFSVAQFLKDVEAGWSGIGIPATVNGLFKLFERRVFSASYSNNPAALQSFRRRLKAYEIPYGYN